MIGKRSIWAAAAITSIGASLALFVLISAHFSGGDHWWTNLSGCPLILRMTGDGQYMDIVNLDSRPASEYSLGCLSIDDRGHLKHGPIVLYCKEALPPNGFTSHTTAVMKEFRVKCGTGRWSLTVVMVRLDDGTVWTAKDRADRAR